ncbi:PIG-L family deacetylase [Hymenobacter sp. BT175]|uniref:PIG-L deacetylase family protein n=1 Tax=Hymenobacter translucens TaxID=2886507 RepID=UPI001D0E5F14|nr:PIG-L family deacetylase [Hymenobacter translucens]MCC2548147.1 PIG-L family deacetylase [Hymenobacter translucens]
MTRFLRPLLLALLLPLAALAQAPKTYTSSEILLGLKKLNVLGSVLYIAAHPDDENTRLISYLANGRLLETGYLSCTRGDGGQNLIGPELREQLGVIRTQELLAARRIDGGKQFFTRANDFGFSKTAEETFTIWDKEQVLADMVWVIRQRRPDVLITRFPPDARAGHGHHTASAILAAEAFDAAGDPKRFPEQLKYVDVWQPKRLFWNTGSFFVKPGENMDGYLKLDAGGFNPLLGQSYGEIAARSRSQHRSQGFGSAATRGEALEYLQQVKGDKASKDPFEGIDQSWNRVKGGAAVGKLIDEVIRKYDPSNPAASVTGLLKVRAAVDNLQPAAGTGYSATYQPLAPDVATGEFWKWQKVKQIENLIQAALGLYVEATTNTATATVGQPVEVTYDLINRSSVPVGLTSITSSPRSVGGDTIVQDAFKLDKPLRITKRQLIPLFVQESQPYWLRESGTVGMYMVPEKIPIGYDSDRSSSYKTRAEATQAHISAEKTPNQFLVRQQLIGQPENLAAVAANLSLRVGNSDFSLNLTIPVQYKRTDPVLGELYQPLTVVPPVAVNIGGQAYIFAENQPKTVPVTLKAGRADAKGTVVLQVPAGWKVEPASIPFDIKNKDEERTVTFQVQPTGKNESAGQLRAVATLDGQPYSRGIQTINYPHIPVQTLFPEAVAPLVKLDLKRKAQEIGYLMGAGDEVPDALRQLGYSVSMLKAEDLNADRLKRFDAVVLGVRAYNTLDRLKYQQKELLEYVEKGGTVIVQYTVSRGTVLPEIGPYPLKLSSDRVTVENAPVTFLKPQHPLLNVPNKITSKDFEGWQQEQGLYYPSSWDPKYQTIISSQDPGEKAKESAILVADYGKGHYIYTGLSFFRELPAGVPGAYRLFTNMIELGQQKGK